MMSSGVTEWRVAQPQHASLAYSLNTNISIAEPAHLTLRERTEWFAQKSKQIHCGGLLIHPDLFAQTDFRLFC
jgi:hypothetical protein